MRLQQTFAMACCLSVIGLLGPIQSARAAVCASEQDRLVWARERMLPDTPPETLKELLRWLVESSRRCASSGDLWYFRGLVEERLAQGASTPSTKTKYQNDSVYSLKQAKDYKSEQLASGFNPFEKQKQLDQPLPPHIRERYALIVGVNKFKGESQKETRLNNLRFSVHDAQDLRDALVSKAGFKDENVKLLVDEDATLPKVTKAFGDIRTQAQEDDLVLLYFASHGLPHEVDPTGISYVALHDTDFTSDGSQFSTALPMLTLANYSRVTRAKRFVLLLDTCYSGAAAKPSDMRLGVTSKAPSASASGVSAGGRGMTFRPGAKPFTVALDGMQYAGSYITLSASQSDEESFEDEKVQHGYFTYYLLKTLADAQFAAPLSAVFATVQKNVTDTVSTNIHRNQHPVIDQNSGGEKIQLVETSPTKPSQAKSGPRGGRVIIVGDAHVIPVCGEGKVCLKPGTLEKKNQTLSELELPDGKLDNWGYGYVRLSDGTEAKELCPESDACSIDVICDPKGQKISLQIAAERGQVKVGLPRNQFAEKFAGDVFESNVPMAMASVRSSQLDNPIPLRPGAKIEIYYSRD